MPLHRNLELNLSHIMANKGCTSDMQLHNYTGAEGGFAIDDLQGSCWLDSQALKSAGEHSTSVLERAVLLALTLFAA